jgi:hypothetical protein
VRAEILRRREARHQGLVGLAVAVCRRAEDVCRECEIGEPEGRLGC